MESTPGNRLKERVTEAAALLGIASVAAVFAAAGGAIPGESLPASRTLVEAIPHVNALLSVAAIGTITAGWRAIRNGRVERHRTLMVASFLLFVTFLVLYLYKVVVAGTASFGGPETVYRFVYLPVLGIHMLLAVVSLPLLYYVLLVGLTHDAGEIPATNHRRVGRVAATLWLTSFALGIVVYALLYVLFG